MEGDRIAALENEVQDLRREMAAGFDKMSQLLAQNPPQGTAQNHLHRTAQDHPRETPIRPHKLRIERCAPTPPVQVNTERMLAQLIPPPALLERPRGSHNFCYSALSPQLCPHSSLRPQSS